MVASLSLMSAEVAHGAGDVFSFGWNAHGATGLGTVARSITLVATPIDASNLGNLKITQVAAGRFHSLLLAEDGTVFSFGANSDGQTGLGIVTPRFSTPVATAIDTSNLGTLTIIQVAAGERHSLLLAEDGRVFSFGANTQGQTGLGTTEGNTPVAVPIDTSNLGGLKISQVSAGLFHSLLLAEDGRVFSFGQNSDGRTGLGMTEGRTLVATAIDTSNLGDLRVTQLAAGSDHSLLLTEEGRVFSFGSNGYGQTGLEMTDGSTLVATPIDASNLGNLKITQVATGLFQSLLLAENGSVFSFGSNYKGATGLGIDSDTSTSVATAIDTSNLGSLKITKVTTDGPYGLFTDRAHGLLLAEDGRVFSFGSNSAGQTGLGTASLAGITIATAIDTANLRGLTVTDVSAGGLHSLLVAEPAALSFAEWLEAQFSPEERGDLEVGGPLGDPSGSGVPNVSSYLFGLNPRNPERRRLPSPEIVTVEERRAATRRLALRFDRRHDREGFTISYEFSPDLLSWTPVEVTTEEILGTGIAMETVRVHLAVPVEDAAGFVRTRIHYDPNTSGR